jgi:hypothetical protein
MLKQLIKSLDKAKARVETLEAKVEKGLKEALATVHAEHGFDSVDGFIKAVKKASKEVGAKGKRAANSAFPRAKRAKITAAIRKTVKELVKARKSGAEVAKAVGISTASVQNIKKALGLVRTAKKKAPRSVRAEKMAAPAGRKLVPKARKKRKTPKKAVSAAPAPAPAASAPTV